MGYPKTEEHAADPNERARRMGDLQRQHALPLADVALLLDLPVSTIHMMRAQGTGPHTFLLGRRIYVLQADLHKWLDQMAKTPAD